MRLEYVTAGILALACLVVPVRSGDYPPPSTPSTCPQGTTCTPSPDCPGGKHCTKSITVLKNIQQSTPLQCGNSNERNSTVTVSVKDCGPEKCLVVEFGKFADDTIYKEVHLMLSANNITVDAPGKYNYTKNCEYSDGNKTATCTVPIAEIYNLLSVTNAKELCTKTLHIGAHAAVNDTSQNSCWGQGSLITGTGNSNGKGKGGSNGNGNWAMEFTFTFECEEKCIEYCCCAPPPEPTPTPPPTKYCHSDTAFGYTDNDTPVCSNAPDNGPKISKDGPNNPPDSVCPYTLNDLGCKRWGWYSSLTKAQLEAGVTVPLYAGAGQNDIGRATLVGNVTITKTGTTFKITYRTSDPYTVGTPHVYLECADKYQKGNQIFCAPGQYRYNGGCQSGKTVFTDTFEGEECDLYTVIFHAAIAEKVSVDQICAKDACYPDDKAEQEPKM